MSDFKRVILKDPVTGDLLAPKVPGTLMYEEVNGTDEAPFSTAINADTLNGKTSDQFATADHTHDSSAISTDIFERINRSSIARVLTENGIVSDEITIDTSYVGTTLAETLELKGTYTCNLSGIGGYSRRLNIVPMIYGSGLGNMNHVFGQFKVILSNGTEYTTEEFMFYTVADIYYNDDGDVTYTYRDGIDVFINQPELDRIDATIEMYVRRTADIATHSSSGIKLKNIKFRADVMSYVN